MSKLPKNHPIELALKKSKISTELAKEFSTFLTDYPDWESQSIYLLQDKGVSIENIVEDLYDVPVKDQPDWKPIEEENVLFESADLSLNSESISNLTEYIPRSLFKDWKQEHGFESIPVEVGDIHTFIRFETIITKDQIEKFKWTFNRSRYGKRGWGNERLIKSINKSLLDNNNNPGWVVKTFLDENQFLNNENDDPRDDEEIPNPLILSARDTHALILLLLGHPYFFYKDSVKPIRNAYKKVTFQVNVHSLENHKIVAGFFYISDEKENLEPIITEEFIENGIFLSGPPRAIIYNGKYMEVMSVPFSYRMMKDSFRGVLIPNDEWDDFLERWKSWYPSMHLNMINPEIIETPSFIAREIKNWKYWLTIPEDHVKLYKKEEDIAWIELDEATKTFNTNRIALQIKNFDYNNQKLISPSLLPVIKQTFDVVHKIQKKSKTEDGYYSAERHIISQLFNFARDYPYARSYINQHLIGTYPLDFRITIKKNPDDPKQYLLQGEICHVDLHGKWKPLSKEYLGKKVVGIIPSFLLYEDQFVPLSSMISGRLINDSLTGVLVEENEISDFYATALPYLRQRNIKINDPQGLLRVSALYNYQIQGVMTIWEVQGVMMGRLKTIMHTDIGDFDYPLELNADEFQQVLDQRKYKIPKNFTLEQKLKEELYDAGWVEEGNSEYSMREDQTLHFVLEILPIDDPDKMVQYVGAKKLKRWKTKSLVPTVATNIQTGIDWFNVDVAMEIDGKKFNLDQLIELWKSGKQAIELPKSQGIAVIDQDWISKYAPILNRLIQSSKHINKKEEEESSTLQVEKFQIGLLNELEAVANSSERDEDWSDLLEQFKSFQGIKKKQIPKEVQATLRDYQREGVNWLCFLRQYGFGGILADDMGLGKTLQTLAFLAIEKKKKIKKPNLVICPTSVVTNWRAEANKFTPHLNVILLHGNKRKSLFDKIKKSDLVITTYGLLQRDLEFLSSIEYHVAILDEAQIIKNPRSKTAQSVQQINATQRLTLTGTPIENSVSELWSQFHFLMPGFFGSLKEFERNYIRPASKKKKKSHDHALLRRQTKPFILRRMKQDVAKELPPKIEQTLYCEMGAQQRTLYDSVLELVRRQIKEKLQNHGLKGAKITVFDALLKLRQICCEPKLSSLVGEVAPESAKMNLFVETLSNIVEEGHRVLVFSQFVKMLNLIQGVLKERNIPFLQLDGTTRDREGLVKKFQEGDEFPVFLISLKAGGTGINLTAADYVIHYDPWWNPAAEAQATDRAYRIGQQNNVHVYKLITRNSIEEKILELQEKKKAIARKIVGTSDPLDALIDFEDIQEIFAL